ncbi:hypothetical protein PVT67_03785 [Gallaecimonas kandeliae]|uniref:hypothetical protein n=1 Tax=Gallaecimonas kandeliae TaxID=3029055 RepID=UPI00264A27BA|nr:hypothetical protein [Gallaecimonas kandeliae]WKE66382.1 hypothetical protein PVT67_03785 [Gallaecimonas kandeliae]
MKKTPKSCSKANDKRSNGKAKSLLKAPAKTRPQDKTKNNKMEHKNKKNFKKVLNKYTPSSQHGNNQANQQSLNKV